MIEAAGGAEQKRAGQASAYSRRGEGNADVFGIAEDMIEKKANAVGPQAQSQHVAA